jgi:phosphoribosyl-ATP pyrophosphohydrolase/phosphoribosyl-AMP cyclohydrolase
MTDRRVRNVESLETLSFWENGLLPVVAQDADTGRVLMVAFANREALERTLETGQMHYWSRSRQELWHKGATSGNFQDLVSLHADCDTDTLLALVRPKGPSCHTGDETCFGDLDTPDQDEAGEAPVTPPNPVASERTLPSLWAILEERAANRPAGSYTARLLDDENLRLKKLGEETAELILALSRKDRERVAQEGADLVYHLLVALLASGVSLDELLAELEHRKA